MLIESLDDRSVVLEVQSQMREVLPHVAGLEVATAYGTKRVKPSEHVRSVTFPARLESPG